MNIYFLVGAIIGSGLFMFAGREPALRLLEAVHRLQNKNRPR